MKLKIQPQGERVQHELVGLGVKLQMLKTAERRAELQLKATQDAAVESAQMAYNQAVAHHNNTVAQGQAYLNFRASQQPYFSGYY
jgi:hypothetical protein